MQDTEYPTRGDDRDLAARQAAGLRALADMLEANPHLAKLANYLERGTSVFYAWSKGDVAAIVRAALSHGFKVDKHPFDDTLRLELWHGPVGFVTLGARSEVCERVVTGTRTVTKTVPDPAALADVPLIEVTEEVETVEWRCEPLLAEPAPEAVAS